MTLWIKNKLWWGYIILLSSDGIALPPPPLQPYTALLVNTHASHMKQSAVTLHTNTHDVVSTCVSVQLSTILSLSEFSSVFLVPTEEKMIW